MTISDLLRSLGRFRGKSRALHLSWSAFFVSFVLWFDFAPFAGPIGRQLHLSTAELTTISLCNVGLTVPGRMLVGMAVDRFGPRRVFPVILFLAVVPNTVFALADTFSALVLSRLALSVVGGGFVVGTRMVAEWWPPEETGAAEGVYGGWGNLGGGVATVGLPLVAAWLGGAAGWRWAIGLTGLLAAVWGVVYLTLARDTPDGAAWSPPAHQGALEVTSRRSVLGLALLVVPVAGVLGLTAYRIELVHVISTSMLAVLLAAVVLLAVALVAQVFRVNRPALAGSYAPAESYPLRSVALCCLAYAVTFGGELAMLSMLPTFFGSTWHLGVATAGAVAGTFGLMNLVTRPGGGVVSDLTGRRRAVLVAALVGVVAGFAVMSRSGAGWPVAAVAATGLVASACLQAGSGATFAVVPQIAPRLGGQVAGLVGAYGNIGGTVWLFLLLYITPQRLFAVIAACGAAAGLLVLRWLPAPAVTPAPSGPRLPAGNLAAGNLPAGNLPAGNLAVSE
ncbi:MAG TPA: MFS transporter [Acidimicrobiales bacterium]|nr:MFS transporter [Acidimicrobiales bacterium]